jgi:hypothetical protein
MMLLSFMLLAGTQTTVTGFYQSKLLMSSVSTNGRNDAAIPIRTDSELKKKLSMMTKAIPLAMAVTNPRIASAAPEIKSTEPVDDGRNLPLGADGYTELGGLSMCKILNGMWQVSGGHGYEPLKEKAVSEMSHCAGCSHDHPRILLRKIASDNSMALK